MTQDSAKLPADARALIEAPNFAYVGTNSADGSPHVVPTWIDVDGDHIFLNSAEGRTWPTNADRDGRVFVAVPDKDNPYQYAAIHGRVTEITAEGADDHADAMAKKYLGKEEYPFRQEGEVRILVKIAPEKVSVYPS